jgi:hypothetical protein
VGHRNRRWQTTVRVGVFVAVVRLGLFWGGLALYTGNSDGRQLVGYVLLIVNSVAELGIAAAFSGNRPGPPLLVAGLILLTSFALGWAWARNPFNLQATSLDSQ